MLEMNTYPVFLTVRAKSTRLPRKCFLDFGGCSVLEHVVKRSKYYGFTPFILTTIDKSDDETQALSKSLGIPCFRGSIKNKLKRWHDASRFFEINFFHTIDVDDPFFSGEMVIESMHKLWKEQLDVVFPTKESINGSASVGYSFISNSIASLLNRTNDETDTEMIDVWLKAEIGLRTSILESMYKDTEARLTLDYPEDYEFLLLILNNLGRYCSRDDIVHFIATNPTLSSLNGFRNLEWKLNQDAIRLNSRKR